MTFLSTSNRPFLALQVESSRLDHPVPSWRKKRTKHNACDRIRPLSEFWIRRRSGK